MSPTTAMTEISTQILVEVLHIFGIATKELKRGSASKFRRIGCIWVFTKLCVEKFLRKLAGMADLGDALKRLDRLTQEEARMANAEVLRLAHSIRDGVEIVDGKVDGVDHKVDGVGDKVECVDAKVQVVIDSAQGLLSIEKNLLTSILPDSMQASVAAQETRLVIQQAANDIDEIKCSWLPHLAIIRNSRLNLLAGSQLIQLLRSWLSPADPSTNHNIAQNVQHSGTAAWLFQGQIIVKWKSNGSLLWIHGKRMFLL